MRFWVCDVTWAVEPPANMQGGRLHGLTHRSQKYPMYIRDGRVPYGLRDGHTAVIDGFWASWHNLGRLKLAALLFPACIASVPFKFSTFYVPRMSVACQVFHDNCAMSSVQITALFRQPPTKISKGGSWRENPSLRTWAQMGSSAHWSAKIFNLGKVLMDPKQNRAHWPKKAQPDGDPPSTRRKCQTNVQKVGA